MFLELGAFLFGICVGLTADAWFPWLNNTSKHSENKMIIKKELEPHEEYWRVIETALKQIEYDIHCLDDESILILSKMIHAYRLKHFP